MASLARDRVAGRWESKSRQVHSHTIPTLINDIITHKPCLTNTITTQRNRLYNSPTGLLLLLVGVGDLLWIFMCFRKELGWVYDLPQPSTLQMYGLSEVCTCMCFFRSDELAKRRSQPGNSHLNGFSPKQAVIKEKQ